MQSHSSRSVIVFINFHIINFVQISIPKPIADTCDLRNNSEVVVTKVTLVMCHNVHFHLLSY
jgi:hypothetical protein